MEVVVWTGLTVLCFVKDWFESYLFSSRQNHSINDYDSNQIYSLVSLSNTYTLFKNLYSIHLEAPNVTIFELQEFCCELNSAVFICLLFEIWVVLMKKAQKGFFRWFWDFLKEENAFVPAFLLKSFILNCFSKINHYFQSVLISWVLIAEEENAFVPAFLLKSFILICFSKSNHFFQSVLISWVLIAENITKMSHTQQWFYWNSTFQSWILLKLHCLHN